MINCHISALSPLPLGIGLYTSFFTLPPGGSRGTSGEGNHRCRFNIGKNGNVAEPITLPSLTLDPPRGRVKKKSFEMCRDQWTPLEE